MYRKQAEAAELQNIEPREKSFQVFFTVLSFLYGLCGRWHEKKTNEQTNKRMNERMNERTNERMNERTNE